MLYVYLYVCLHINIYIYMHMTNIYIYIYMHPHGGPLFTCFFPENLELWTGNPINPPMGETGEEPPPFRTPPVEACGPTSCEPFGTRAWSEGYVGFDGSMPWRFVDGRNETKTPWKNHNFEWNRLFFGFGHQGNVGRFLFYV